MSYKYTGNVQMPGSYVRETILKPQNITVKDAAKILGIGRPAFSNFINGKSALSSDMAARIERAFGIPAQKLHDLQAAYDAANTKGAPANTNAYVPPFLGITANEIETWADHNIAARSRLSVLLRTLVNSTGIDLTKIDFPGNDDSQRPGWDGFVVADKGTPWVPVGQSGWEFGCDKNPKTKADKDYAKSILALDKSYRTQKAFIFVTPRRWPGKEQWISDHEAEGQWKEIRAYDASDLEQWLEQSIVGQIWFANETNRYSNNTRSLDQCWDDWAKVASPPLPKALFKSEVASAKSKVAPILAKTPEEPIIIAAESTEEATAFLGALFDEIDNDLTFSRDRVVVFDKPGVFSKLATGTPNFIAVATTREVEREFAPFCRSVHTIAIYPRNAINTEAHILLEPLNYENFHTALKESGYDNDEINRLDNESGRSLTVLRRRLSSVPAVKTPSWAVDKNLAGSLVPFMFAGAWNSTNRYDRDILSYLAIDKPYEELEKQIHKLIQLNDAPVWSVGTYRGVVSKIDLLYAICDTITQSELETYFAVASLVLSEDDPSLDLPKENRPFASLYGKTREISVALRNGISETLVLLAVHGNSLFQKRLGVNVETMAVLLVRELLGDPLTTRTLEAHDRDLPTYAEAAPDEFLRILENDLKTEHPASLGLMKPASGGIFGRTSRTGLLWALENLAWSPSTLSRTVLILARLAEIKIEDNRANKPIASLSAIFRSWMPQTAVNLEGRIKAMELLVKRFPKIAWTLCMDQLGHHQTGSYSHKPQWRNDAQGYGDPVSANEMQAFILRMIDMALSWEEHDRSTVSDLIEQLHGLDEPRQTIVWTIIKNWAKGVTDFDKAWIREKIRVTIFSRKSIIKRRNDRSNNLSIAAQAAYSALEPADILNKNEWLFREVWINESFNEVYDDNLDYQKREERIRNLRIEALEQIKAERGIEGILTLADMGKTPHQIGYLMTSAVLKPNEVMDFILTLTKSEGKSDSWTYRNLTQGAMQSIIDEAVRMEVLKKLGELLPVDSFVKLLELAPFNTSTWAIIEGMSSVNQQVYWANVIPTWWHQNDDELNDAVDKLLIVKRPSAAFTFVHLRFKGLRPAVLFRLMEALALGGNEAEEQFQFDVYDIHKAFKALNASASFSVEEMMGLELIYIDFLTKSGGVREECGIPNIEKYITTHPEFFAQVVAWLYKREDGEADPKELRLDNPTYFQNRAKKGYKLLDELHFIPGRNKQGDIEYESLLNWVHTVRKSYTELGRLGVGDRSLGKLLAAAPQGTDGVWPCEPVRDVLEQIQSENISNGITTGLFNSRGAHMRAEGGDQERGLATIYRKWAKDLEFSYPFVATTILKSMADSYERLAQSEDTEAGIRRRLR